MLGRLEKTGHLKRVPSPEDRRKVMIQLTDKDRRMQEDYGCVSAEMTDVFYKGLTPKEINDFERRLMQILQNVEGFERA
jgi:MarR family transcriptional regulator, organic hydroperoxide resistance regulator